MDENEIEEIERTERTSLLKVKDLKVYYPIRKGIFKRTIGHVRAVDSVTIDLHAGETVAIVGESGSGKTTMGKGILQLLEVTSGDITYQKTDLNKFWSSGTLKIRFLNIFSFRNRIKSLNI